VTALQVDHLVVGAHTLDNGVAWCEATFGVRPTSGGEHRFMGTHNRVFDVSSAGFARVYLEIIAIAPTLPAPAGRRWFDLDDGLVRQQLKQSGPQLLAWAARCDDIALAAAAMRSAGIDAGEVMDAERMTPAGLLRWRIALRADGARPCGGAAPILIEWGERHPTDTLIDSGVRLESLQVGASVPDRLLPAQVRLACASNGAALTAAFATPRGRVTLHSPDAKG